MKRKRRYKYVPRVGYRPVDESQREREERALRPFGIRQWEVVDPPPLQPPSEGIIIDTDDPDELELLHGLGFLTKPPES